MSEDNKERGRDGGDARLGAGAKSSADATSREESPGEVIRSLGDPELDPFEIEFSERHKRERRGPRGTFVNSHGVVIGDHDYESPQSPLENWSKETDPAVMAGDEWVHPYKDVGFRTAENRDIFENDQPPQGGIFMHPTFDVAHRAVTESEAETEARRGEEETARPDDPKA